MNGVIIHKRLRLRVLKENNNRTSKQMFVQISIAPETDNVNSFKKLRLKFLVWCKQIKNQEKYLDKIHSRAYNEDNKRLCDEQTFVNV